MTVVSEIGRNMIVNVKRLTCSNWKRYGKQNHGLMAYNDRRPLGRDCC